MDYVQKNPDISNSIDEIDTRGLWILDSTGDSVCLRN
jgi:hypothetical protein